MSSELTKEQKAMERAHHLGQRAVDKMGAAIKNRTKARLAADECQVILWNLQTLAERAEKVASDGFEVFAALREEMDKLTAEIEGWQASTKGRKTLPQTLAHVAEGLHRMQSVFK